jgi:hypothetical protein
MTVWVRKFVTIQECEQVEDRFEAHFLVEGAPRDMMLVSVAVPDRSRVKLIIGLTNEALLPFYPGFERITPESLPREASLLVGQQDRFLEQFETPP